MSRYLVIAESKLTGDWLGACGAAFSKQFSEAVSAVGLLIATSEALPSQWNLTVGAGEALAMPWVILVCNTAGCDHLGIKKVSVNHRLKGLFRCHLAALHAASGKLVLVASRAVDVLLARNERFRSNWRLADVTAEALLMPLARFIFHLFRA